MVKTRHSASCCRWCHKNLPALRVEQVHSNPASVLDRDDIRLCTDDAARCQGRADLQLHRLPLPAASSPQHLQLPPPATLVVFEHSPVASSAKQQPLVHINWGDLVGDTDGQGLVVVDVASGGLASLNRMVAGQQPLSVNGRGTYSTRGSQASKML